MTHRVPPKFGLWLLQRFARSHHVESFMGDLFERCAQGGGRWWAWREIILAILIAQGSRWRYSLGPRVARVFWWGLTEMAIMLIIVTIADQSRFGHSLRDLAAPISVVTLAIPFSVACIGLRQLIRLYRGQRDRGSLHHLVAIFLVMSLGVGMLTWAATVQPAANNGAITPEHSADGPPSRTPPGKP